MPDDFKLDELPEGAQAYIRELRAESARYRTERNEFRDKYTDAGALLQTANEQIDAAKEWETKYESLLTDNSKLSSKHDRLLAAAKFGIPEEADRLKGEKYEDWEADAKALAEKFGSGKPPGLPKDPAAEEPPKEPKDDPITKAFRDAGVL
jgi:chromosome segregation ATPase